MTMIDISKSFSQLSEPVSGFFQQPGVGYYIPLYQREYSWDTENIDQLIEDIFNGVRTLVSDKDSRARAIHFMGTVILFQESNPKANIQPRDERALPSRIDNVIDGQQRISTIALLACMLWGRLHNLEAKLPKGDAFDDLRTGIDGKKKLLLELFSVDMNRGKPARKPIIIRGSIDGWTFDGGANNYPSGVANFLDLCIRQQDERKFQIPKCTDDRVARNIRQIDNWLKRVEKVEGDDDMNYPSAQEILAEIPEEDLWTYTRPELHDLIKNPSDPMTGAQKTVASLMQILAFVHYLVDRCCFTVIKPVSEEWAFDMFQSLNASGTPLTAIETFKPLVVNCVAQDGVQFKDSKSAEYFGCVDRLIGDTSPTSKKTKLTDEFITAFALVHDGSANPPSTQFSSQRRWLNAAFQSRVNSQEREEFIRRMGDLATYWENVLGFEPNNNLTIAGLEGLPQDLKDQAGVCILYLRETGHKMANTILSRFYASVLREDSEQAPENFANACKAVAAFYTLWRAAAPNSGLDDVYRRLLKSGDPAIGVERMCWEGGADALSVEKLKTYLRKILADKDGLNDKSEWMKKAALSLRFDAAKPVCKFALFVAAHDCIPDPEMPGLMKIGQNGSAKHFTPAHWAASDFRTLEHIAPRTKSETWSAEIYEGDIVHKVGNLTLLPINLNSSAGNNSWAVKKIYFRHIAEKDVERVTALANEAAALGVELAPHTIDLLRNTDYKDHICSLVGVGDWTKDIIEARTERICNILWQRISGWVLD